MARSNLWRYQATYTEASNDLDENEYGIRVNNSVWVLTAVASLFLVLRIYCKIYRQRALWWDDYILVLSWISLAISSAMVSIAVSNGYGRPFDDIDPDNLSTMVFFNYASGFMVLLSAIWSKTSFGITILRISDGWTRRLVWFSIITVNAVLGVSAAFQWVQCWPSEKLWKPEVDGVCWPSSIVITYDTFSSCYSGAMDLVLTLLPWAVVWKKAIQKKEKIGVLLAMSMGIFAGLMSFLKIITIYSVGANDIGASIEAAIFGAAEPAISIMAVSVPILRALLKDMRPKRKRRPGAVYIDEESWATALRSPAQPPEAESDSAMDKE